jgi:hypothetical protein
MSAAPAPGLKRRHVWFIDLLELGSTWAETSCPRRRSLDTKVCLLKFLTFGLPPGPLRLVRTRGGASKIIQRSSLPPCLRTRSLAFPIGAMLLSTHFSDLDRS